MRRRTRCIWLRPSTNSIVVRRILSGLQKAGLVSTENGRSGGCTLVKKAHSISLYDVYLAVHEGDLFAYNPNNPNKSCSLSCKMKSVLAPVFTAANNALSEKLKKIKLSDLVEEIDTA